MEVRYTKDQQACIETLIGPVDVSAGAGSGKTFTLTQRIASALSDPTSGVDDIDQVCAITFTEKAAAELKGRVRSTLRANGLFDQALKVDSAWISTIHGMCARILRASALDLGLDPAFKVAMGKEASDLLAESLDEAIEEAGGTAGPYAVLFEEYAPRSKQNETSVESLIAALLSAAENVRDGLDGLIAVKSKERPRDIARRLLEAYEYAAPFYEMANENKTNDAARVAQRKTIAALAPFVAGQGADDIDALLAVLDQCPIAGALRAKDFKEATSECRDAHYEAIAQALLLRGDVLLDAAMALARDAEERYDFAKRAHALLDSTDLIKGALSALERPEIKARFEGKFRLVMVDEFQDTDELQIAIVRHLCGEGMRYLCTVGDAQQSIYGFRGADINVYRAYQRQLSGSDLAAQGGAPTRIELKQNFRSHRDVLAFVKKVCSQKSVFGDDFLDLSDSYDGSGYRATEEPRIQIRATALVPEGAKGSVGDAIEAQAGEISAYFARMHAAGHALSEMVLLLGSTTNADRYAKAIREAGFPCVIAGGSLFSKAQEVAVVNDIVQTLANPRDTERLFAVLSGPAFNLGASDLLSLGTGLDEETGKDVARKLYKGVSQAAYDLHCGEELSPALAHATAVLSKARHELRSKPLHQVLLGVLQDSGWIARLQETGAEGMATLGNIMKAVRLVRDVQDEFKFGVSRTATHVNALIEGGMKEKPGALNLSGQEAIRIMTIHASKGLEFPIVAMADFARTARSGDLVVQRVGGETFVSLRGRNRTFAGKEVASKAFATCVFEGDPAEVTPNEVHLAGSLRRRAMLASVAEYEELAEAQRLFYVGATRAKEAFGLFIAFKEGKDPLKAYVSTVDDVRSAFFGFEPFSDDCHELEYGGSAPAAFSYKRIAYADVVAAREQAAAEYVPVTGKVASMGIAQVKPAESLDMRTPLREETGLWSYSSLASKGDGDKVALSSVAREASAQEDLSGEIASAQRMVGTDETSERLPFDVVEALVREARERADELRFDIADENDEDGFVNQSYRENVTDDEDKATSFGSAVHRLCQLAALRGERSARAHLERLAALYGVEDRERLSGALERWVTSRVYALTQAYAHRQPELSFSVSLDGFTLEGEIDLLCTNTHVRAGQEGDEPQKKALIIDYKTGGHAGETVEMLHVKHGLQACCYAYATLLQGYDQVDVAFARVERDDPAGVDTMQSVCFAFFAKDLDRLREVVSSYR